MEKNKFESLNDILSFYSRVLVDSPIVNARGSLQKEQIFQSFELTDPTNINVTIPARKFNSRYGVAEWLWYLSAESSSKNIGKLAKIWNIISDDAGNVESNYGVYLKPQWGWIKEELLSDPDSRRATAVINQIHHKHKNKKDYPCTHYVQFFIRDQKLHLGVNMRSNDLVFGLCNDVFTFSLFQQAMLNELNLSGMNLSLGSYFHHAGSLHVYDHHFPMIEKISKTDELSIDKNRKTFKLSDGLTWEKIQENFAFPVSDTEKSLIYDYVSNCMNRIFVDRG